MFIHMIAYFFIPAFTVFFVEGSNWFDTNFSVIGNAAGHQAEFVLWGLCVGIYFFWCIRRIISHMEKPPRGTWLVPLSLVLLTFAVTTPYLPESLPLKSFLHIIFAFLASVCLMLCLYLIVGTLCRSDAATYRRFMAGLILITVISIFLFWLAGIVSSALEIFFTISTVILVKRLYERCCF